MLKVHPNRKFDHEKIALLVNEGLSDLEISSIIGCTAGNITRIRKKYNLRPDTDYRKGKEPELTEEQKVCLFGTLLGDGYLRPHRKNYTGRIDHCLKQKEYWEWKCKIFDNLICLAKCSERKCSSCKSGTSHSCYLTFKSNINLKPFFDMFYVPKKEIPIQYLEQYYTPLAMAIHFMDDGTKTGESGYKIMTMGFPIENIKKYQKFILDKYNLVTGLDKKNNVTFNKENSIKLTEIIKDYIVPSMQYKVHQKWVSSKEGNLRPVIVQDITINKLMIFRSQQDAGNYIKASSSYMVFLCKTQSIFKNQFKVWFLYKNDQITIEEKRDIREEISLYGNTDWFTKTKYSQFLSNIKTFK